MQLKEYLERREVSVSFTLYNYPLKRQEKMHLKIRLLKSSAANNRLALLMN